ncbi:MAG: hypothetical protein GEV07_09980 [Streptosporangiales bacterium]|nr:hypothetical protein [Streptosporangiales bacterium]
MSTDVSEATRPRTRMLRGVVTRLSWGLTDQAVSSLTNFAVGVVAARTLDITGFGVFSLAFVTYGFAVNISRGLATDPLMVRYSAVAPATWRVGVARSTGAAVGVGVAAGLLCLLIGLAMDGELGAALLALGVVLPALLLQDSWRYGFFAAGKGGRACANDLVWAAALVPALAVAGMVPSVSAFVLAWGAAAGVAALFGCVQTRILPRPLAVRTWYVEQRDLAPRYLVENVSLSGGAQIRMYGLGAIAGLADVGAVRGAELLLGPFFMVLMGVGLFAVPEAARMLRRSTQKLTSFCLALGAGQAVLAMLWGAALILLLPDAVGRELLGASWEPAAALLLPASLTIMNASFGTGAGAGLRALGAARRSVRAQLVVSLAYVTGGLGGAVAAGAVGSAWGCAVATLIGAGVWWWHLGAGVREHLEGAAA